MIYVVYFVFIITEMKKKILRTRLNPSLRWIIPVAFKIKPHCALGVPNLADTQVFMWNSSGLDRWGNASHFDKLKPSFKCKAGNI